VSNAPVPVTLPVPIFTSAYVVHKPDVSKFVHKIAIIQAIATIFFVFVFVIII
jgi:hypothetical protein